MTASGWPFSRIATPSPSSNHRACSADPRSGPRPPGCLIRLGRHQRRAAGVQPGLVDGVGRGPVVGDPGGRDHRGVVVQVGGRGQPVVLDGHPAAPVGAGTLQQGDRRIHDMKCTDSVTPHKPFGGAGYGCALSWSGVCSLTGAGARWSARDQRTGAARPGQPPSGSPPVRRPRAAAAPPGRPAAGRTPRRGRRARRAAVPGQPAVPALLRPVHRPPGGDERPAAGGPRAADPGPAAPAADPRARAGLRRRDHPQDAVAHVRRRAGRVGADALPGPGHDVRVVAGGLRDGLPVLRDRAGGADQEPVHRRDRRPGGGGGPAARGRRRCPAVRAASPTSCSWAWGSRWPTTPACWPRCAG